MSLNKPDHAFILAAGKGTRLRPYTNHTPKPMVMVDGRPILDHTLEKLTNDGIKNVTINLYHLGDRIQNYFEGRTSPAITFSQETELLETGGGVKLALNTMNNNPFYLINGDALWDDKTGKETALHQLGTAWCVDEMDILLLLQPVDTMVLTQGNGDYTMNDDGSVIRTPDGSGTHMFTGLRITSPHIFQDTPEGAFSFLQCMDKAQKEGRLYGIEHQGDWHHISTPKDLERINEAYALIKDVQEKKA